MFAVAIDGPAGAGKSSVAKAAAKELGFVYVDTGAIYRTIALHVLRQGVDPHDAPAVEALLPAIQGRYHQLKLEREGGAQAVYCCARQPAPADLARIEEVLKRRHGLSKVEFQVKLEPELLGGFVIHLQGTTYDKSVRGMLRGLRRSLKERE